MEVYTFDNSNKIIISLILSNKPFTICRLGIGAETHLSYIYKKYNIVDTKSLYTLSNNAGIYETENKIDIIELYIKKYIESIENSDSLAIFENNIIEEQNYLRNKNSKLIHSRSIEPFYYSMKNIKPWSHYLVNKKVLIINPFVETMKSQINEDFKMFEDEERNIFKKEQKFVFYKSYQTSGGNYIHKNWKETFDLMCNDIKEIEFDIALLGCGGYGLPLCNYIKKELSKSAIYIGGGIQLMFGIMGKRWETREEWKILMKNSKFVRPNIEETIKNKDKIENGCYW